MTRLMTTAALAAALAAAAPALAQQPMPSTGTTGPTGATMSGATQGTMTRTDPTTAESAGSNASVTAGMTVKDKTGAAIGQVTGVKASATGTRLATIKMGAKTFLVETAKLDVQDGAATINATQSELEAMTKK